MFPHCPDCARSSGCSKQKLNAGRKKRQGARDVGKTQTHTHAHTLLSPPPLSLLLSVNTIFTRWARSHWMILYNITEAFSIFTDWYRRFCCLYLLACLFVLCDIILGFQHSTSFATGSAIRYPQNWQRGRSSRHPSNPKPHLWIWQRFLESVPEEKTYHRRFAYRKRLDCTAERCCGKDSLTCSLSVYVKVKRATPRPSAAAQTTGCNFFVRPR